MKNNSSKELMEKEFNILNEIKKVEPSPDLLNKIQARIVEKQNVIPIFWIRTAAAIFLCFLSFETYLILKQAGNEEELSLLIPESYNNLYNE